MRHKEEPTSRVGAGQTLPAYWCRPDSPHGPSWSQVAGVGRGSQAESREPPLISELLEA